MVVKVFKEYAPVLDSAGVTKTDCDKIILPVKEVNSKEPSLTKDKVLAVIAEFPSLEEKGYLKIAQAHGLKQSQVKKIHKEFLLSKNPPEKHKDVEKKHNTKAL